MGKVFLDTNLFIDAIHRQPEKKILSDLADFDVFISTLSVHIYCYSFKIKIPDATLFKQVEKFILIDFDTRILAKASEGPTPDLEDNIQLHSAAEEDCDLFLTADKTLLKMTFFGKTRLLERPQEK